MKACAHLPDCKFVVPAALAHGIDATRVNSNAALIDVLIAIMHNIAYRGIAPAPYALCTAFKADAAARKNADNAGGAEWIMRWANLSSNVTGRCRTQCIALQNSVQLEAYRLFGKRPETEIAFVPLGGGR